MSSGRCGFPMSRRGRTLVGVLGLAFLAVGCETRQESLTKSRIRKVEKGLLRAIYLKGQRPEKLSLNARLEFYKVPGVGIAVMDRNGLEWARAFGSRDSHSREPVTLDTIFQAGDLSQPVAAAAALVLVDKGRLDLDGDIGPRLQSLHISLADTWEMNRVTLRKILTQTEGYAVLQALLEGVTSTPFPSLVNETVFGPFGMKNSTFDAPLTDIRKLNAASGHGRDGRPVEGKWLSYPAAAACGLWTTPSDLLSFAAGVLQAATGKEGKVLSASLARAMLTPQAGPRGLGFAIDGAGTDVRFHLEGRTRGYACSLVVYPYKGQGAVVMTNSDNGFLVADEILRAVSAAYEWPDFKPQERPLFRLDPSIYQDYVGRYQVTPDYALDVTYEDFYLIIRPTGQAPTRFFVENQTFFFSIDPYVRIQFLIDDKGRVKGLILWQQDFKQEAKKVG
jgi:CubicO group peptidase (beta-lactamase class C family)